jgi:hypothetical protein
MEGMRRKDKPDSIPLPSIFVYLFPVFHHSIIPFFLGKSYDQMDY